MFEFISNITNREWIALAIMAIVLAVSLWFLYITLVDVGRFLRGEGKYARLTFRDK